MELLYEDEYPEVMKRFEKEFAEDCYIDQMNIGEKSMGLIGIKHKWVARYMLYRHEIQKLNRTRKEAMNKILKNIEEKQTVQLSKAAMDRMALKNATIIKIDEMIENNELILEYLEKLVNITTYATNDIRNFISQMTLETT